MKIEITRQEAMNLISMLDCDSETLEFWETQIPDYYKIYQKLVGLADEKTD